MATRTKPAPSANGAAPGAVMARAKDAGGSVASAASRVQRPLTAAGAGLVGLAGGLALASRGSKRSRGLLSARRTMLGVPVGRERGWSRTATALGMLARELGAATSKATATREDLRQIREQLDQANRRSPIEVLLDGLTHRRGAHKNES